MVDPNPNRREFLKATACFGVLALGGRAFSSLSWATPLGAGAQDAAAGPLADLIRAAPTARFYGPGSAARRRPTKASNRQTATARPPR